MKFLFDEKLLKPRGINYNEQKILEDKRELEHVKYVQYNIIKQQYIPTSINYDIIARICNAWILYPDDEKKREEVMLIFVEQHERNVYNLTDEQLYFYSDAAEIKNTLKKRALSYENFKDTYELREQLSNGYLTNKLLVNHAESNKIFTEWNVVYDIIYTLMRIDYYGKNPPDNSKQREASFELVKEYLSRCKTYNYTINNIKITWKKYQKVAPLIIAFAIAQAEKKADLMEWTNLRCFLANAAFFRKRLLDISNKQSNNLDKKLFKEDDFYDIPKAEKHVLPEIKFDASVFLEPLTKTDWLILDDYKSS
jgi:hypothetical protein